MIRHEANHDAIQNQPARTAGRSGRRRRRVGSRSFEPPAVTQGRPEGRPLPETRTAWRPSSTGPWRPSSTGPSC